MPVDPNKPQPLKYERSCRERIRGLRELIESEHPAVVRMGTVAHQEFLDWMKWAKRPTVRAKHGIPFEGTAVALDESLVADRMECGLEKHKIAVPEG